VALTWLATQHPIAAGSIAVLFLIVDRSRVAMGSQEMKNLFRSPNRELAPSKRRDLNAA